MSSKPQMPNIVRMVRMLTLTGVLMVVLSTGLLGWKLLHTRTERTQLNKTQVQLRATAQALRDQALLVETEIRSLLDEAVTSSQSNHLPRKASSVEVLDDLLHTTQFGALDDKSRQALIRLQKEAEPLIELARLAEHWHRDYATLAAEFRNDAVLGDARNLIALMRGLVMEQKGRLRLAEAVEHRRWREASPAEATDIARRIVEERLRHESHSENEFEGQLSEVGRLVEMLNGEEHLDHLAALLENELRPELERLKRDWTEFAELHPPPASFPPQILTKLEESLLGQGTNQTETLSPGKIGLHASRKRFLELRQGREPLLVKSIQLFERLESANEEFNSSIVAQAETLAAASENQLNQAWQQIVLLGAACAVMFFWAGRKIGRNAREQLQALDRARHEAEASERASKQLMQEQQRANADLEAAHREVQSSERLFRTLNASAPIGIFLTDPTGLCRYTNQAWTMISGMPEEESRGDGWQWALHPDDASEVLTEWKETVGQGREFEREFRFRTPEGAVRWVHARATAIRSEDGGIEGHVATIQDITDRRRAEDQSKATRAFLDSVIESLPLAVFIKETGKLRFVLWNKAGEKLTGISKSVMVGRSDQDFFPAEYVERFRAEDQEVLRSGQLLHIAEQDLPTRHQGLRTLRVTKVPIFDASGKANYIVGVAEDITEQKKAEAEIAEMNKRLLETSRMAGMAEVATGVLHNVGNVLNSVNVSATLIGEKIRKSKSSSLARVCGLLREHPDDLGAFLTTDPKGRQIPAFLETLAGHLEAENQSARRELEQLARNVEHIKDIVAMQQTYAKISGVLESLHPTELVQDALRINAASFTRHELEVTVESEENLPKVSVDKHKALQILINLLRNAKHACDDSGQANKRIGIRLTRAGEHIRIVVTDNGVGIPGENLQRIFNHGFTTRKEGHGFGLHSGANAAKELGGRLCAASDGPGLGASFTLELPCEKPSTPPVPSGDLNLNLHAA